MGSRSEHILDDTTIMLQDGTQFRTRYEGKRHIVTCDLCFSFVKLPLTANPKTLESHRKACKARQEKRAFKQFRLLDPVPKAEETLGLQHLFRSDGRPLVECPGQWVQWSAGSLWETYPFRLHSAKDIGYTPISIDEAHNGLVVRAKRCWKMLEEFDSEEEPRPCLACREVPRTAAFKAVLDRAKNVKEHTSWFYLTDLQKEKLMREMVITIRRLRSQINNGKHSRRVLSSKIQEYKRIMMLIASNDIPRLSRLLSVSRRHGSSATAIAAQIERAIDGLYSPQGGFTGRDLDVAFLSQAMGGRRLLHILNKSHGLASEATVRRNTIVPRMLPSVGIPTAEEVKQNITAFFNPEMKPPSSPLNNSLPGNILALDGISIEKKCRYCPKQGKVLGLCREHSPNMDMLVGDDATIIGKLWDALESNDANSKVCWGSEATVVVVAPYGKTEHYSPTPLVLSATDKSEKADDLCKWMQTVIDTWRAHPNGEKMHGPLWSIASDGDATFRRARHKLCNRYPIDPQSPLGLKIQPLRGLNLYTSKELITATCDPKHVFKRFATLLRGTGLTIRDQIITSDDIRDQLLHTLHIKPNEVADLMDSQDKQNVPKAVKLLRYLGSLRSNPPIDESRHARYLAICFISAVFAFFMEPFVNVHMSLKEQLVSLSTYAHLAVALQLEHGPACLKGPLYADTQAIVKNIFFVVARLQLVSSDLTLHIIHEGTDRLERLFGDCRTLDHGRNFDVLQLSEKLAIACHINAVLERNPDLDHGHRRLDLATTIGIDHVNPRSWLGDTRVGGVELVDVWNRGRGVATETLKSFFGEAKVQTAFNYDLIFADNNRDILRPNGIYIGLRHTREEVPAMGLEVTKHIPTTGIQHDATDVIDEGLFLDDGLPDNSDEVQGTPQSFLLNGAVVKIDSALSSIHPNSWRQSSDRIYRVQGHHVDKFNTSNVDGLIDAEDAVNDELLKIYDIIGVLVRVEDTVCFAAMEVKGVTRPEEKKMFPSARFSDLDSPTSKFTVHGQLIKLIPSKKQKGYWEWSREYVFPSNSRKTRKKQTSLMEVPSYLIHPLTVNMISYHNATPETRLRWAFSTEELEKQMLYAWNILSPESNSDRSHFESIPIIEAANGLPYRDDAGSRCFIVKNVPNYFLNRNISLQPEDMVHCFICGDVVKLETMRGHVGKHILSDNRVEVERSTNSGVILSTGLAPCGFCGLEGCTIRLTNQLNGGHPIITSSCIYYTPFDYWAASKGDTEDSPCSNIPIHCNMCSLSSEGEQHTIWKYNAPMHILLHHEELDRDTDAYMLPDIPVSMKVKIHIPRAEESALGIKEHFTMQARADFKLPDSDDLPLGVSEDCLQFGLDDEIGEFIGKRQRSETQSSSKPPYKKHHF